MSSIYYACHVWFGYFLIYCVESDEILNFHDDILDTSFPRKHQLLRLPIELFSFFHLWHRSTTHQLFIEIFLNTRKVSYVIFNLYCTSLQLFLERYGVSKGDESLSEIQRQKYTHFTVALQHTKNSMARKAGR